MERLLLTTCRLSLVSVHYLPVFDLVYILNSNDLRFSSSISSKTHHRIEWWWSISWLLWSKSYVCELCATCASKRGSWALWYPDRIGESGSVCSQVGHTEIRRGRSRSTGRNRKAFAGTSFLTGERIMWRLITSASFPTCIDITRWATASTLLNPGKEELRQQVCR